MRSDIMLNGKYVIIKKDGQYTGKTQISDEEYNKLLNAANILEEFNYLFFLGCNYEHAKETFLKYDFSQFGVREIDIFAVIHNALNAITTNLNMWETYLKRKYKKDKDIFPFQNDQELGKSYLGLRDSEYYDNNVEYVVTKALRNMAAHSEKPFSEIWYDDNYKRHFAIHTDHLMKIDNLNKSGKEIVSKSGKDYFDVIEVIKRLYEIIDELNINVVNFLLKKEWINFYSSRITVREIIGVEWDGAYLVSENTKYPKDHMMRLNKIDISKNAMQKILSIAAQSL